MSASSQRAPRRVLIYRLGSLGDTLVALPAFRLVARTFPDAERRLLTNFPVNSKAAAAAAILEHTGLVDAYFPYRVGTRSPRELIILWWRLMRWRPQVLVYLGSARGVPAAKRDERFFRLCGIRRIVGVPVTEDMQESRAVGRLGGETLLEREGARLVRNIAECGAIDLDDPAVWGLRQMDSETARADKVLAAAGGRSIIAVSMGTKAQANDWGRENWRLLLRRLGEIYPDYALALLGAVEESEVSEFAASGWRASSGAPVVNLCGLLRPRESAAVLARCAVFLGHDSGPMHLAAAAGTTCVAIFSARNPPGVWFPYGERHRILYHHVDCAGCRLETCVVQKKKCITSISVDEVLAQVAGVLAGDRVPAQVR